MDMYSRRAMLSRRVALKYGIKHAYRLHIEDGPEQAKSISDFKKLFNNDDRECRIDAWNALSVYIDEQDIRKELFTDEEYQFILKRISAEQNSAFLRYFNPGKTIRTDRLIIKPANDDEMEKEYQKHLKEDGDFEIYTGLKLTSNNVNLFNFSRPFIYAAFEKTSGKMIGTCGIHHYDEKRRMAEMEWYVFKPFRQKGYGKEMVSALAKKAFDGKLCEMRETVMEDVYRKHYAKIDILRVDIKVHNNNSRKLALACGFKELFIDKRHFATQAEGLVDGVIMELEPGDLLRIM